MSFGAQNAFLSSLTGLAFLVAIETHLKTLGYPQEKRT
jgi:hypothetical protein